MHKSKIIFTALFLAVALSGYAQERKAKNTAETENTKAAPTQAETTQNIKPAPPQAGQPTAQPTPAPQPEAAQPMQAMPQTTTNGDAPVEGQMPKQPKDKSKKDDLKAKMQKKKDQK